MSRTGTERARIERERAFFERMAAEGGELAWAERTAVAQPRREMRSLALLDAAALGDGQGRRALEIGCGGGAYTEPFARRTQAAVTGIDLTPVLLRQARSTVPSNVHLAAADAAALPFASDTFDAVVGNAVLHHLPVIPTAHEILRVLRPGGRFCFAEPNLVNPHMALVLKVPWLRRMADGTPDETAFVRWRLRRVLMQAGLVQVTIRPFDFLYPLTPRPLIGLVTAVGTILERLPLVREIAGSLLIVGRKPDRTPELPSARSVP